MEPMDRATLRTARLLLRPFTEDDVADALRYRNDEEFARFLPHIPQPFTRADAERFVRTNMTEPWDRFPIFAIEVGGELIGTVNLEVERANRSAMLGYAISRAHWGKGITPEAAGAAIEWALNTFDLARIWASTDARHGRSRRVMEKLGMHFESTLPAHHRDRTGAMVDEVVYGLARTSLNPPAPRS